MLNIAPSRHHQIPVISEPRAPVPFHLLLKPMGPACNLACRYCYYPQGTTPVQKMSDELLEAFIRRYIAAQPASAREINFVWHGGEPLLAGLGFYKKALALQQRYAPPGVTISNSLQTNATLLSDSWCRFFRDHNFIIGVSLEGGEVLQNQHRPDKRGQSSYAAALRGIARLQLHQVEFNLLVVVHDSMAGSAAEIYDLVVNIGARYLQFQPLMSEGAALREGYYLSAENWGDFMVNLFRHWKKCNDVGRVYIINFEQVWGQYFTYVSASCVHATRCGSNLVMEPDGHIYACDHLINAAHRLGHLYQRPLTDVVTDALALPFGQEKSQRPECQLCAVKMVCQGGCPAHLNQSGYNQLCSGYFHFFSEILATVRAYSRDLSGLRAWREAFVEK